MCQPLLFPLPELEKELGDRVEEEVRRSPLSALLFFTLLFFRVPHILLFLFQSRDWEKRSSSEGKWVGGGGFPLPICYLRRLPQSALWVCRPALVPSKWPVGCNSCFLNGQRKILDFWITFVLLWDSVFLSGFSYLIRSYLSTLLPRMSQPQFPSVPHHQFDAWMLLGLNNIQTLPLLF